MAEGSLLAVDDLAVSFQTLRGRVRVLDGVSFEVRPGEILGIVGESGSGKSVTALSVMRLLGEQGHVERGAIRFGDRDLLRLGDADMLRIRGREISMIFQEPMTSLNPVYRIGFQIAEVLVTHLGLSQREARRRVLAIMREVGIPAAEERMEQYPHQLSGGMRQRVMIAIAMVCSPKLLIADEPTTALDVTIQAQILDLMRELRARNRTAILMITHDMGVIAAMADRVLVMYGGQIVESAPVRELFARPRHPYTRLLLQSMPSVRRKLPRLSAIPGMTPSPTAYPEGCRFHPRCPAAVAVCRERPPELAAGGGRSVRCWRADELAPATLAS